VYIGDQTRGEGAERSIDEQAALETRTRMLNPKWYEGMLKHGYEGVRRIEVQATSTMGWSAQLDPTASARAVNPLLEASERRYRQPGSQTLEALRRASVDLDDRLEGVHEGAVA
jgi:magnesium chelatase subunit H